MTAKIVTFPGFAPPSVASQQFITSAAWHREARHFANAFLTEVAAGNRDSAERLAQHALRYLDAAMRNDHAE